MAIYRNIQVSFWSDSKIVDDFTPEDRYFYLYLFTNPHTSLCGCYEISIKQMVLETGYSREKVGNLIGRFETIHKVAIYSPKTKEILLVNWHKYNWTSSEKFLSGLHKSIAEVKNPAFKDYLLALVNGDDTVSIPYMLQDDTVSVPQKPAPKKKELDSTGFEEFWQAYPRQDDKAPAREKYIRRLRDGYSPAELLSAAQAYRRKVEQEHTEKKFIKMGKTFLGTNGPVDQFLLQMRQEQQEIAGQAQEDFTDEDKAVILQMRQEQQERLRQ